MKVFYDQDAAWGIVMTAAKPGPNGQQQIARLEASGGVIVNRQDQTATGEGATFDMKSKTVILRGNVLAIQGKDLLRAQTLEVDLATGMSRVFRLLRIARGFAERESQ
jgi:lipopolysaccharide export system protein LptA